MVKEMASKGSNDSYSSTDRICHRQLHVTGKVFIGTQWAEPLRNAWKNPELYDGVLDISA
jgi:hypothetical protein